MANSVPTKPSRSNKRSNQQPRRPQRAFKRTVDAGIINTCSAQAIAEAGVIIAAAVEARLTTEINRITTAQAQAAVAAARGKTVDSVKPRFADSDALVFEAGLLVAHAANDIVQDYGVELEDIVKMTSRSGKVHETFTKLCAASGIADKSLELFGQLVSGSVQISAENAGAARKAARDIIEMALAVKEAPRSTGFFSDVETVGFTVSDLVAALNLAPWVQSTLTDAASGKPAKGFSVKAVGAARMKANDAWNKVTA
jgi:hypothetical protein